MAAANRSSSRGTGRATKTYAGGCHCGRIKIEFSTDRLPGAFVPRMDQCGFCQRHRAMAIADSSGSLVIHLAANPPAPYRFGFQITDFHVCDRCGVWVAATWRDGDRALGVVNVPALDDRALFNGQPIAVDFSGEDVAAREARRRSTWTPAEIVTATY